MIQIQLELNKVKNLPGNLLSHIKLSRSNEVKNLDIPECYFTTQCHILRISNNREFNETNKKNFCQNGCIWN
jgi:hypothetical protein